MRLPPSPAPLVWTSDEYDAADLSGELMNFRLIYEGPLKSTSDTDSRAREKHGIRRALHPQLQQAWVTHPTVYGGAPGEMEDKLARDFARCGHQFVPYVFKDLGLLCDLDILMLRRERPGRVVGNGGDLDNRLKTLFDALRIPDSCGKIDAPAPADDPRLYCLLEDDAQITGFSVTTDRLLTPLREGERENDVVLVIRVSVRMIQAGVPGLGMRITI